PSWRLQQEISEDRLRRVEIVLAHEAGALVRLRFVAPRRSQAPVISTAAYDVEAEADLGGEPDALASLFDWLHARLAAALPASAAPALADDAVERSLRGSVLLRGRQRV